MARKALIRSKDEEVVNIIVWEPGANWTTPVDHYLREPANAGIGDRWDGSKYVKPASPGLTPDQQAWAAATAAEKIILLAKRQGFVP